MFHIKEQGKTTEGLLVNITSSLPFIFLCFALDIFLVKNNIEKVEKQPHGLAFSPYRLSVRLLTTRLSVAFSNFMQKPQIEFIKRKKRREMFYKLLWDACKS